MLAFLAICSILLPVLATNHTELVSSVSRRRLQFEDFVINTLNVDEPVGKGRSKKSKRKGSSARNNRAHVFSTTVDQILVEADRYHMWWTGPAAEPTVPWAPAPWGAVHRPSQNAIFTTSILQGLGDHLACSYPNDLVLFLGSARKVFDGDLVIAMEAEQINEHVKNILIHYKAVVYELPKGLCSKEAHSIFCGSADERVPATVFRYYFYEKWAAQYTNTMILVTDFRDIFFQADPFAYHKDDWFPDADLAVFQEFAPNMLIKRCKFNKKVLSECYGEGSLRQLGDRAIISSGAVLGSRNGLLVWTHFITRQLQDAPGRQVETRCFSGGIDHSFINWLVYGNKLRPFMKIKLFAHGEGAVNTLGGLRPDTVQTNITGSIKDFWGLLVDGQVLNWNQEVAPVVHQLDHFQDELLALADKSIGQMAGYVPSASAQDRLWQLLKASRCLFDCKDSPVF